jgi:hypothetical protein
LCIRQIITSAKAGVKDPGGVLKLALEQRELQSAAAKTLLPSTMDPLYETVASTYKLARRLKDNKLAQQMLSLLVVQKELKDCDIREMCSVPGPQPVAGDSVRFRGKLLAANGVYFPDVFSMAAPPAPAWVYAPSPAQ